MRCIHGVLLSEYCVHCADSASVGGEREVLAHTENDPSCRCRECTHADGCTGTGGGDCQCPRCLEPKPTEQRKMPIPEITDGRFTAENLEYLAECAERLAANVRAIREKMFFSDEISRDQSRYLDSALLNLDQGAMWLGKLWARPAAEVSIDDPFQDQ